MLPMTHPAYLLRNPAAKKDAQPPTPESANDGQPTPSGPGAAADELPKDIIAPAPPKP